MGSSMTCQNGGTKSKHWLKLGRHTSRSSFRDWCEERTNVPRTVSDAALAHVVKDKTEAAYNRTDLFNKRRDLMRSGSWSSGCWRSTSM
jgi:hypothetical protein